MSSAIDLLIKGADALATAVAGAISEETGLSETITFPIAKRIAAEYVAKERAAVTSARDEALAKAGRARKGSKR